MTDAEVRFVRVLLDALHVGQWVHGRCPRCGFQQARGHKCSCPVKMAIKRLQQATGGGDGWGLDDDDLIVERALMDLKAVDEAGRRAVVRAAVDAAIAFGGR